MVERNHKKPSDAGPYSCFHKKRYKKEKIEHLAGGKERSLFGATRVRRLLQQLLSSLEDRSRRGRLLTLSTEDTHPSSAKGGIRKHVKKRNS